MLKGKKFQVIAALVFMFCADTLLAQPAAKLANDYPNRPVRILVGAPPGGGSDAITRRIAQKLAERWDSSVVVDNRGGASGVIANTILAQAAADGYTMLIGGNSVTLIGVQKKVPYDIRTTFDFVSQLTLQAYVLLVNPGLPANSIKELIALAKSKPGTMSYGSAGNGTVVHLGTELLKSMTGTDMIHVPYKGNGPALVDVMGGRIHFLFNGGLGGAPFIKAGKLKAIAVTSRKRMQAFPSLPTIAESGVPGFDLENFYGVFAPAGLPPAILTGLNREIVAIMNAPEMKESLALDGTEAIPPHTPAELKAAFTREFNKWEKFLKESKLKIE